MFRQSICVKIFLTVIFCIETTDSSVSVGEPYITNMVPSVPTMKTITKKNERLCAIECAKTEPCFSFSFGDSECNLWDAKYIIQDKLLKNVTGHTYYHFNHMPEATEIQLSRETGTYEEAFESCQKLKRGTLFTIHDEKAQKRLGELMNANSHAGTVWIGMNGTVAADTTWSAGGAALEFDLRWADGHVFTAGRYQKFIATDPNIVGTTCVSVNIFGWGDVPMGWGDEPCEAVRYYVCQFAP